MSSGTVPFGPSTTTVLVWPPRRSLLFEEVHAVAAAQEIGGGQAGDARADDRDVLHATSGISVRVGVMSSHLSMTNH